MAEWTLIHFLCPKLIVGDGLRVGPWHWKLSKCSDTRGRENTAVFRGARARRRSTGLDLCGDFQGFVCELFQYSKFKLAFKLIESATVTRARRGCRHGGPGNGLGDKTWDRLTRFISRVREAGESVGLCPVVIPDDRMTNDVKPVELIRADIWKHTTPAICYSAALCLRGILC